MPLLGPLRSSSERLTDSFQLLYVSAFLVETGCLPQKHHIVFTKEDFVLFLKQHNVHVGPNFTELSKLPK